MVELRQTVNFITGIVTPHAEQIPRELKVVP